MSRLLKKSLISIAFAFLSAGAMAENNSNTDTLYLKWGGVLPRSSDAATAHCIIKVDTEGSDIAHNAGKLIFVDNQNDNAKADIKSATKFGFTVVTRNSFTGDCDEKQSAFTYTLNKFSVEIYKDGVFEKSVDEDELGKWRLLYSQSSLEGETSYGDLTSAINKPQTLSSGGNVALWVEGQALGVDKGDMAQVQAYVLIDVNNS